MMMSDRQQQIPSGPENLTNRWLTDALRGSGAVSTAAVSDHSWTALERQGAAGVVVRVALEYDAPQPQAPATVVAKFASPYEPIRTLFNKFGGYRNEVEFYRQFGSDAGIPVPHCIYADIDPASGVFVLLLEDMRDSRVGDPLAPSVEDTELAIRYLAPFHAKWWGSERLREFEWLRYPGSPGSSAQVAQRRGSLANSLTAVQQRFGEEFPSILATAGERLLANWDKVAEERLTARLTLVHRDFHSGQMFFPSDRGGRFVVFDWQTVGVGHGADDLARIVAMGLTVSQREAHDRRLIELYHSELLNHGVVGYELEQCVKDFRLGLTSSLITNVVAAATIDLELIRKAEAEMGVSLTDALFGRLAAAFEAHDVLSLLPGTQ
jgi:hypothetical protein